MRLLVSPQDLIASVKRVQSVKLRGDSDPPGSMACRAGQRPRCRRDTQSREPKGLPLENAHVSHVPGSRSPREVDVEVGRVVLFGSIRPGLELAEGVACHWSSSMHMHTEEEQDL